MNEKDEKPTLNLEELPVASKEAAEAAIEPEEEPNLIDEGDGEAGKLVEKAVTPVLIRQKLGVKRGFQKDRLWGFLLEVEKAAITEALNVYEHMGRPVIAEGQPVGVSMETELSFMLGTLDDLKKIPAINGQAKFQVQKCGPKLDAETGEESWGPLFEEPEGTQPIYNAPEETIAMAIEGAFAQLRDNTVELMGYLEDDRSYKALIQTAFLWDKKPEPIEAN